MPQRQYVKLMELYQVLTLDTRPAFPLPDKEMLMPGDDTSPALTLKHDIGVELEIHSQRGTQCHGNLCRDIEHRVEHNTEIVTCMCCNNYDT